MLKDLIPVPPSDFSTFKGFPEESGSFDLPDIRRDVLGRSEEGRPIPGFIIGRGPIRVSLLAGSHADEPVGPETLRTIVRAARSAAQSHLSKDQPENGQPAKDQPADGQPAKGVPGEGAAHTDAPVASNASAFEALSERCTLFVIPHINPDGEARNRRWMDRWPDIEAYMRYSVREKPGRDVEFSWPDRRPENAAAAAWLRRQVAEGGPMHIHASLHGMGYSDGAMLLIDRHWSYRTERLQSGFTRAAVRVGLRMHDNNRKGEKGFFRIAPGFTTTPEGRAMRTYFESHGDPETAALFSDSSMEFVRSLGGDPLCIVTELPLFLVRGQAEPERPAAYMAFKERLPEIKLRLEQGRSARELWESFGLDPLDIQIASALHLEALDLAVATVGSSSGR